HDDRDHHQHDRHHHDLHHHDRDHHQHHLDHDHDDVDHHQHHVDHDHDHHHVDHHQHHDDDHLEHYDDHHPHRDPVAALRLLPDAWRQPADAQARCDAPGRLRNVQADLEPRAQALCAHEQERRGPGRAATTGAPDGL